MTYSPLETAETQELVQELVKRCDSIMLAYIAPGSHGQEQQVSVQLAYKRNPLECIWLTSALNDRLNKSMTDWLGRFK